MAGETGLDLSELPHQTSYAACKLPHAQFVAIQVPKPLRRVSGDPLSNPTADRYCGAPSNPAGIENVFTVRALCNLDQCLW